MYFFIANILINEKNEYKKYVDKVNDVFNRYNGKYLAFDDNPQIIEGEWKYRRCVLIGFDSKEDFDEWYNSEAYQEILSHRLNAAKCDTILIKGDKVSLADWIKK